jgi:hypothetical protein
LSATFEAKEASNVIGNLGEKHGPATNELSNLKRNFLNIR